MNMEKLKFMQKHFFFEAFNFKTFFNKEKKIFCEV